MTYADLDKLNQVIGTLHTTALPTDAFISILELKQKLETQATLYKQLRAAIFEEYEVQRDFNGSVKVEDYTPELLNNLAQALEALAARETELETRLLLKEEFEKLREQNTLSVADFTLLYRLLVR